MAKDKDKKVVIKKRGKSGAPIYGLGLIGDFVYNIHYHSGTFWLVILAVLKAIVWPALVVYHLLLLMHM